MPRKSLDTEVQKNVIRWYEHHGDSIRTIAKRTGVSYGQINAILRRNGVELRPRGGDNRGR